MKVEIKLRIAGGIRKSLKKITDIHRLRREVSAVISSSVFELSMLKPIRWWGYHCLYDIGKGGYMQYGMHFFNPHPIKNADLVIAFVLIIVEA